MTLVLPMLYTGLRAFHAVAEQHSFTRAAERLEVSQPTVSEQVKSLESTYRVRLFERRGRQVALTDTGRRLHTVTARLFRNEIDAEQVLRSARQLAHGRLKVGADSPYLVVPLLGAFKRRYPGIQISMSFGNSQVLLDALLSRQVDVVVVPEIGADARLHALPLKRDRIVAILPRGHAWVGRRELRLAELVAATLVLRESGSRTRAIFERGVASAGLRFGELLEIGSREAIREAVAAHLGVGIIAESEVGNDPRLVAVAIEASDLEVIEYVACVAERRSVQVVDAFLAMLQEAQAH